MTTATTECLHVRANHGPLLNVIGDHQRIILTGEQTGGTMTLLANCNSPGTGIPLHFHGSEDEAFYILEGEVEFTVAFRAGAGEAEESPRRRIVAVRLR